MHFDIQTDSTVIYITIAVWIIPILIFIPFCFFQPPFNWKLAIPITTFAALIPILTFLFSPQSYSITNGILFIQRPTKSLKYEVSNIRSVSATSTKKLRIKYRKLGSGGLYGYFGSYVLQNGHNVSFYTRAMSSLVQIEFESGEVLILSPKQQSEFIKALTG